MSSALLLGIAFLILLAGYIFYGGWLAKQWKVFPDKATPANLNEDGIDYVPTKPLVVFGHHFSSIAGAGPVNGPIIAAIFGWVPVVIWVIFGSIFMGAVQDFGAMLASVRNEGKSHRLPC